ncbi:hypothetical protein SAMN05444396_1031, partial [Flavobacterium segetis]
ARPRLCNFVLLLINISKLSISYISIQSKDMSPALNIIEPITEKVMGSIVFRETPK